MRRIITRTATPLLSLFVFMLSNGLFTTLSTVRLHQEGYTSVSIGVLGASFYAGLFIGSFKIEALILKVGHIRAYSAFAAGLTSIYLLHGIIVQFEFWVLFRFFAGICTAGLFVVIESWLLIVSDALNRGKTLAVYMLFLYSGQALGQFLLHLGDPETLILFSVAAILSSLSIMPLSLTKIASPIVEEPSLLDFKSLFKKTSSGVVGCFIAGAILSVIYSLLPLYVAQEHTDTHQITTTMAAVIFGGMIMQYPLGRLSDIYERRIILVVLNALTIACSALFILSASIEALRYLLFFIFGGLTFTIYPISISHACDSLDSKEVTAGTQALLLSYSFGAVFGPMLAPGFMRGAGPDGIFYYFITVSACMLIFVWWRSATVVAPQQEDDFIALVQTTPVINEIDPRTDDIAAAPSQEQGSAS